MTRGVGESARWQVWVGAQGLHDNGSGEPPEWSGFATGTHIDERTCVKLRDVRECPPSAETGGGRQSDRRTATRLVVAAPPAAAGAGVRGGGSRRRVQRPVREVDLHGGAVRIRPKFSSSRRGTCRRCGRRVRAGS